MSNVTEPAIEPETRKQILSAIETVGPGTMTVLKDTADGVYKFVQTRAPCKCCTTQ